MGGPDVNEDVVTAVADELATQRLDTEVTPGLRAVARSIVAAIREAGWTFTRTKQPTGEMQ